MRERKLFIQQLRIQRHKKTQGIKGGGGGVREEEDNNGVTSNKEEEERRVWKGAAGGGEGWRGYCDSGGKEELRGGC